MNPLFLVIEKGKLKNAPLKSMETFNVVVANQLLVIKGCDIFIYSSECINLFHFYEIDILYLVYSSFCLDKIVSQVYKLLYRHILYIS